MTSRMGSIPRGLHRIAGTALLLVASGGCGMRDVSIPDYNGAGSLAESVRLTANPDILIADGQSTSVVSATLLDKAGKAIPGRDIYFIIADASGSSAAIGTLNGDPVGATARTDGGGVARVTYKSPPRPDSTTNRKIFIGARLVGTDANGASYSSVQIELRSAEPFPFPQIPGNTPPTCSIILEPSADIFPAGFPIGYSSAVQDDLRQIVRYEWFFGDGNYDNKPSGAYIYRFPGQYSIVHVVTDNGGLQGSCARGIEIQ